MNKLLLAGIAAASLAALLPADAQQAAPAEQHSGGSSSAQQDKSAAPASISQDEIMQAQEALNQKGFDVGKADGIFGPRTKRALSQFQQDQGLQQSGRLDGRTLAALGMSHGQQGSSDQLSTTGQGSHASSGMDKGSGGQNHPSANQAQQNGGSQANQSH